MDADGLQIGYVGGGSRGWAQTLMTDLALQSRLSGDVRLYDVDSEAASKNAELGRLIQRQDAARSEWSYTATTELARALDGVDIVVLSTQDPPQETMAHDIDVPKEYGIYQSVGDTVGPGGTFRAMRAIPQYRRIAAAIREHCPDAWVLNYTNPMTLCTRTLYEEYPDINAIGICHEVYHAKEYIADRTAAYYDVERELTRQDIDVNVKGINHFTWIDEATWNGRDCFPALEAERDRRRPFPNFEPGSLSEAPYLHTEHEITHHLFECFDCFPAAGDRHLAEFVPWYLDVEEPAEVHQWGIRLTPSEPRVASWPEGDEEREAILDGEQPLELDSSGEELVAILGALAGGEPIQTNCNLPNQGQISNLPTDAVVETNAVITENTVRPVTAGPLPDQVHTLLSRHVGNQETLLRAGFEGDLGVAFQSFVNEPLCSISMTELRSLFRELVDVQQPYLADWDLDTCP